MWRKLNQLPILFVFLGCEVSAPPPTAGNQHPAEEDVSAPCSGRCENNDWPQVIIAAPEAATVAGELSSGARVEGVPEGCPALPRQFRCDYSLAIPSTERELELVVGIANRSLRHAIELRTYNTCGREIAYVEVDSSQDSGVNFSLRYISPCSSLDGLY